RSPAARRLRPRIAKLAGLLELLRALERADAHVLLVGARLLRARCRAREKAGRHGERGRGYPNRASHLHSGRTRRMPFASVTKGFSHPVLAGGTRGRELGLGRGGAGRGGAGVIAELAGAVGASGIVSGPGVGATEASTLASRATGRLAVASG